MDKRVLEQKLKENGWQIVHGSKHDSAIRDGEGTKIPIPRHQGDLDNRTVRTILKEAGLDE